MVWDRKEIIFHCIKVSRTCQKVKRSFRAISLHNRDDCLCLDPIYKQWKEEGCIPVVSEPELIWAELQPKRLKEKEAVFLLVGGQEVLDMPRDASLDCDRGQLRTYRILVGHAHHLLMVGFDGHKDPGSLPCEPVPAVPQAYGTQRLTVKRKCEQLSWGRKTLKTQREHATWKASVWYRLVRLEHWYIGTNFQRIRIISRSEWTSIDNCCELQRINNCAKFKVAKY